ncbi:MAG: hypothetical protein IT383_04345 [Deltaproteobacteria bacterium]|nr:hypothetical protein [Deltaproteobacteria bacterium]
MTDEKKSDPFGSLLNAALGQIDEIRDVIVRGSQAGKAKIDAELLKRQRDRALAELGAALLHEVQRGALALPGALDEAAKRVRELEAQIAQAEDEAARAFGDKKPPGGGAAGGDEGS